MKAIAENLKRGRLSKQCVTFMNHLNTKRNYHPDSLDDLAAAVWVLANIMAAMSMMCRGITDEDQYRREFDDVIEGISSAALGDPRCANILITMMKQRLEESVREST